MAEVVQEIDRAFETDSEIDELGMVLSSEESVVLVEHKLGISMAVLKPLFLYSVTELQKHRDVLLKPVGDISPSEEALVCSLSRAILLVKGDFPPALNARKIMIEHGTLCAEREINFLNVVFSKHPKSPSAWHHRRWCLQRLLDGVGKPWNIKKSASNDSISFSDVVEQEVGLCERMCDLYPRNYYSWNHRLWLAQHMSTVKELEAEYDKISVWLKRHVSDHSAVNHQHQVTLLLVSIATASVAEPFTYTINLYQKIFCESMKVLHSGGSGGHASLWSLRRMWVQSLLTTLQHLTPPYKSNKSLVPGGYDMCFENQDITGANFYSATETESDELIYLANIQSNVLYTIIDNIDTDDNDDTQDSFVGLSGCKPGSTVVEFSAIENELDLSNFLQDGVTYAIPGVNSVESVRTGSHEKEVNDEAHRDEVAASLQLHSSRISALFQKLFVLQRERTSQNGRNCDERGVKALVIWLSNFVTEELLFVGTCINTSGWYTSNCWDPQRQKVCGLEYCAFIIYQVLHFIKSNGLEILLPAKHDEKVFTKKQKTLSSQSMVNNFIALAEVSCTQYFQEGVGLCAGKMKSALSHFIN